MWFIDLTTEGLRVKNDSMRVTSEVHGVDVAFARVETFRKCAPAEDKEPNLPAARFHHRRSTGPTTIALLGCRSVIRTFSAASATCV